MNWDIAFNPVRSIQRIGRIHRINSSHKVIHIKHFFPDIDIESYIKLEERLRSKLQASQSTTHTSNPFSIEQDHAKEDHFKKYRQLLANELIAFENTTTTELFSSPINLLQSIAYKLKSTQKDLPDGLFSIVHIPHFKPNAIFAALESTKPSKKHYFTLYDTSTHKSVTPQDQSKILSTLAPYMQDSTIPTKDFSDLERISQNYRDIRFLKTKFEALTTELDTQIKSTQKSQDSISKSDSGFIPLEKTRFKLIAWLLINPDFTTLNQNLAKSLQGV